MSNCEEIQGGSVSSDKSVVSEHDKERLAHCERVIERGINTFVTVGAALSEIPENALYRSTHGSFGAYIRERWDMSRQRAHQLETASVISRLLRDNPTTSGEPRTVLPSNERQLRALACVPEDSVCDVWDSAVAAANGNPSYSDVEASVDSVVRKRGRQVDDALPEWLIAAVRSVTGHDAIRVVDADHENAATNAVESVQDDDAIALLMEARTGEVWFRRVWEYPTVYLHDRVRGRRPSIGHCVVFVTHSPALFEAGILKAFSGRGVLSLPTEYSCVVDVGECDAAQ